MSRCRLSRPNADPPTHRSRELKFRKLAAWPQTLAFSVVAGAGVPAGTYGAHERVTLQCKDRPQRGLAMSEFFLVVLIAATAAFLTYLGAPIAERFEVPQRAISAALQFAAGVLLAVVAISLLPPAVELGPETAIVIAFFVGGASFALFEYAMARQQQARSTNRLNAASVGFYVGILADMAIDGMVIGIASTQTLLGGLLLALGIVASTAPLAFVTTATAKRNGVPRKTRRLLSLLYVACMLGGAILGFALLRNQSDAVWAVTMALASGFLLTTVTQSIIPEANRDGEPSFSGVLFVGGIALYALLMGAG